MDNLQEYNTTRSLVQYSIAFYLRSKVTDHSLLAELPETYQIPRRNPTDLQSLIAKLCIDTKNQNNEFFEMIPTKLAPVLTEERFKSTFLSIAKQMINEEGLNWGRIISLFTFAGVLSQFFIENKQPLLVVEISTLLTDFINENENIMPWIISNGGWNTVYDMVYQIFRNIIHPKK